MRARTPKKRAVGRAGAGSGVGVAVDGQREGAVRTRAARREDHAALEALWRSVDELHARLLPAYFRRTGVPARAHEFVDEALGGRDQKVLVAELGGKVVGLVHVELYDTPPVPAMVPRRRAHIEDLVVAGGHRRAGIGRLLMREAARWAHARGATQVVLTVWRGNDAARRFYEALGFREVSRVLEWDLTGTGSGV
jgi:diamine N-acetyltransferase